MKKKSNINLIITINIYLIYIKYISVVGTILKKSVRCHLSRIFIINIYPL